MRLGPARAGCCASRAIPVELCLTLTPTPECVWDLRWCALPPVRGGRAGGGGVFFPRLLLLLIDVVTLCSPGPGLSRAGRGTDIPCEWDRSSRSARGPLSSAPSRCVEGEGCGPRPGRALLPPARRAAGVARGLLTRRTLSARPLAVCRGRPSFPAVGWGPSRRRAACLPLGARARFARPSVVLLERSGLFLRCPRPSWRWSSPVPREPPRAAAAAVAPAGPRGEGRVGRGKARARRPRVRGSGLPCQAALSDRDGGWASDAGRWLRRVRAADFVFGVW